MLRKKFKMEKKKFLNKKFGKGARPNSGYIKSKSYKRVGIKQNSKKKARAQSQNWVKLNSKPLVSPKSKTKKLWNKMFRNNSVNGSTGSSDLRDNKNSQRQKQSKSKKASSQSYFGKLNSSQDNKNFLMSKAYSGVSLQNQRKYNISKQTVVKKPKGLNRSIKFYPNAQSKSKIPLKNKYFVKRSLHRKQTDNSQSSMQSSSRVKSGSKKSVRSFQQLRKGSNTLKIKHQDYSSKNYPNRSKSQSVLSQNRQKAQKSITALFGNKHSNKKKKRAISQSQKVGKKMSKRSNQDQSSAKKQKQKQRKSNKVSINLQKQTKTQTTQTDKIEKEKEKEQQTYDMDKVKNEVSEIMKILGDINSLGQKKDQKITIQETKEIFFEMNGVFQHITEQIELTANPATKELCKPLKMLLKGFNIYHTLYMKQQNTVQTSNEFQESMNESGQKNQSVEKPQNESQKTPMKESMGDFEFDEERPSFYDSISLRSQIKEFRKAKPLPQAIQQKLKLDLQNLPPQEDFISVTDSNQDGSDDSMNEEEWEQIIQQVMEKGYFVDKNGEKQELPDELLQKIKMLQNVEENETTQG